MRQKKSLFVIVMALGCLMVGSVVHAQEPDPCVLIASDNSDVDIDTSPGVCVLVKTLNFNLDALSDIRVDFNLGHSHGCCHHDLLDFRLNLDGGELHRETIPFVQGAPSTCADAQDRTATLSNVSAGPHILEVFLCDEGRNCKLEVYQCPPAHPPFEVVHLDIKPQSCPNPLNVKSKGLLPAAICGTEDFDVTGLELVSLTLAGVAPVHIDVEDVATPFEVNPADCLSCTEEGPDGFLDLTLKFDMQEIVAALGKEIKDGDCMVLELVAELGDGSEIRGKDVVIILKKGK